MLRSTGSATSKASRASAMSRSLAAPGTSIRLVALPSSGEVGSGAALYTLVASAMPAATAAAIIAMTSVH